MLSTRFNGIAARSKRFSFRTVLLEAHRSNASPPVSLGPPSAKVSPVGDAMRRYARYDRLAGGFASRIPIDGSLVSDLPGFMTDVRDKCQINENAVN